MTARLPILNEVVERDDAPRRDRLTTLLYSAVVIGLVARVVQYLWRRSYWHDESYLVLNVMTLTYRQLVGPLPHAQSAPPLFLVAQKAVFNALGGSEFALRLIPLLAGGAAVVLMAILARRVLGSVGATVAVTLFALSDRLIAHAVEAKQYSSDVLIALVLLLAATHVDRSDARRLLATALIAAASLWVSHPTVFVFGGIALALLPGYVRRGPRGLLTFAAYCAPAAASFAALYVLSIRYQEVGDLYAYWADRFPDWSHPWTLPLWLVRHTMGLCTYPYELGGALVFPLALLGAWSMWHDGRRQTLGLLVAPAVLTLLASCVGRYPFGGSRVTLFLAPMVLMLAGGGADLLWRTARATRWRWAGLAVPGLVIAVGAAQVAFHLFIPRHRGHVRPAVEYVRAHRQGDEPVYVLDDEIPFRCYWRAPDVPRPTTAQDLAHLVDLHFWVVYAYGSARGRRDHDEVIQQVERAGAVRVESFNVTGGAAHRFVRTAPAAAATSPASPATRP